MPEPTGPDFHSLGWPRRTARLFLRPARAEDAAELWPWYHLPEVTEWISGRYADSAGFATFYASRCEHYLVAELDGRLVANLKLAVEPAWAQAEITEADRGFQAEIGWSVDPSFQGRGLATEAASELLAVAFDDLGLHRVTAECFAGNAASEQIMRKLGMRREAHFVANSQDRSGRWHDSLVYAVLADEWHGRG